MKPDNGNHAATPGPWEWSTNYECPEELKGCFVLITENGRCCKLAQILSRTVGHQGICEANARLMASSPGLVEALEEIMGHLGAAVVQLAPPDDAIIAGHLRSALVITRQALRKAKA